MSVNVVVHAEGPGDLGRPPGSAEPGHPLLEDDLGPAHDLVRRTLEVTHGVPPAAVGFRTPFRTTTGAPLEGSKLLSPRLLDEALGAWILDPPLVVLLVDADGHGVDDRAALLEDALHRNGLVGAAGVAVQELEAWLLADPDAVATVLGAVADQPEAVEALDPGEAKARLARWTANVARPGRGPFALRRELAQATDLDRLAERTASYRLFREAIARVSLV